MMKHSIPDKLMLPSLLRLQSIMKRMIKVKDEGKYFGFKKQVLLLKQEEL